MAGQTSSFAAGGDRSPSHLLALGGAGFTNPEAQPLDDLALELTGAPQPKACLVPTASGDASPYVAAFYRTFARRARCTHVSLFARETEDLRELVLAQDLLYIGGGNTANLLALWRLHGLDVIVREAWEQGTVLVGVSAGACALFDAGVSASFGAIAPLYDGLGLIGGGFCPHYHERRITLLEMMGEGLGRGYGAGDDAALHFVGEDLHEALALSSGAAAFRVEPGPREHALAPRLLSG
jgi:dipeptidase E